MNLQFLQKQAATFVKQNSAGILTGVGVVGTMATAVLSGKATLKATQILRKDELTRRMDDHTPEHEVELDRLGKLKKVWPQFIPPVLVGGATIASIVFANRMSAKRAAALAAAYTISENRLQEYKAKVEEKLGIKKEQAIRDEIAQDHVTKNPPPREVIVLTSGDVLCLDEYTGRYFRSTMEQIKQAEIKINGDLFNHQYASLSSFYDEIGLRPTSNSDSVGWNHATDGPLEVQISTATSPDNHPCLTMDFARAPHPDYTQLY